MNLKERGFTVGDLLIILIILIITISSIKLIKNDNKNESSNIQYNFTDKVVT